MMVHYSFVWLEHSCLVNTVTALDPSKSVIKRLSKHLTLKAPRNTASENVVCLCRLLNILANFSKLFFAYR